MLAAEATVHVAAAQVGVATAELFPQITVSANYGSASFHSASLFTGPAAVWGAGATLAQPVFHGGALRAKRRAAVANYDASVSQYQRTVLNAFQNVADSLTALSQDALALQAAHTAAATAQQSFSENTSRLALGAVSYPSTVASEQRWQNASAERKSRTPHRAWSTRRHCFRPWARRRRRTRDIESTGRCDQWLSAAGACPAVGTTFPPFR